MNFKTPELLFTAEDKLPVYQGESWYYVKVDDNGHPLKNATPKQTSSTVYLGSEHTKKEVLRFKLLENAQMFVDHFKPKYSEHDVQKMKMVDRSFMSDSLQSFFDKIRYGLQLQQNHGFDYGVEIIREAVKNLEKFEIKD